MPRLIPVLKHWTFYVSYGRQNRRLNDMKVCVRSFPLLLPLVPVSGGCLFFYTRYWYVRSIYYLTAHNNMMFHMEVKKQPNISGLFTFLLQHFYHRNNRTYSTLFCAWDWSTRIGREWSKWPNVDVFSDRFVLVICDVCMYECMYVYTEKYIYSVYIYCGVCFKL